MGKSITTGFISDKVNGITIKSNIKCNGSNYNNYVSRNVNYVVMHYTGNFKDTAWANANFFTNANKFASAHFLVDDTDIYQSVALKNEAWHCGSETGYYHHAQCRNYNSFGIEMCCTAGNYTISSKTITNAAYLCANLCTRLGITSNTVNTYVLRHYDVTLKKCPAQMADYASDPDWVAFKTMVKNILNGKKPSASTTTPVSKPTTSAPAASKKNLGKVNITMQGYTNKWWSPVVNDSDWVGQADGVPLRYLAVKVDKGTITGRVYTQGSGWLPKLTFGNSYNIKDLNNGVLGDGTPIQAVELYYNTPSGYNYQKVHYQVSGINTTAFYSEQVDNEKGNGMDGYAGAIGVNIDKIKAYIK